MSKLFLFAYPSDKRLADLLNLAIFSLNPDAKWPAHVTLAGPFSVARSFNNPENFSATVRVLGVGNFFRYGSSTVFLHVGAEEFEPLFKKPDFKGNLVPHLSLYDGNDRHLAEIFYDIISKIRPFFFFRSDRLEIVSSTSGQLKTYLRERVDVNAAKIPNVRNVDDLRNLPLHERVEAAVLCIRKAQYYLKI